MSVENPYQAPEADCPSMGKKLDYRYYSPDKCPHCESKVTRLRFFFSGTPNSYLCVACGTRYRIVAPLLTAIHFLRLGVGAALLWVGFLMVLWFGVILGWRISGLILGVGFALSFFVWGVVSVRWPYRQLQKCGKFVPWDYNEAFD